MHTSEVGRRGWRGRVCIGVRLGGESGEGVHTSEVRKRECTYK